MKKCLFCQIIAGKIPAKFVYRDKEFVAFYDIAPKAPVHILVVPVQHRESLREVSENDKDWLGKLMVKVAEIARKAGLTKSGYKVVINNGSASGQMIFHLHLHLLGGWREKTSWLI